jgi:prepilin-type N-terminal cleavage/methylation domain-containing protein
LKEDATMASRRKAFTLIELLAVIAIIGIRAAFIFAAVSGAIERAKIAKTQGIINDLNIALTNYERDLGSFETKLANNEVMPTGPLTNADDRAKVIRLLTGKKRDGSIDKDIRQDPRWNGPYMEPKEKQLNGNGELVDSWNHPLMIRIKRGNYDDRMKHRPDSFEIYSWGPNEVDDTGRSHGTGTQGGKADDINNWD